MNDINRLMILSANCSGSARSLLQPQLKRSFPKGRAVLIRDPGHAGVQDWFWYGQLSLLLRCCAAHYTLFSVGMSGSRMSKNHPKLEQPLRKRLKNRGKMCSMLRRLRLRQPG